MVDDEYLIIDCCRVLFVVVNFWLLDGEENGGPFGKKDELFIGEYSAGRYTNGIEKAAEYQASLNQSYSSEALGLTQSRFG